MYTLIKAQLASKFELEEYYTLDESLKLYALYRMDLEIEQARTDELRREGEKR